MSVETCLSIMNERTANGFSKNAIDEEFQGAVVMTRYKPRRTYKVASIARDKNPVTYTFQQGNSGKKSMAEYFMRTYEIKIQDTKQHLFKIEGKRGDIYLPPELCSLVGIPTHVRENFQTMNEIRRSVFKTPNQRIESMINLNKTIAKSESVLEWGLKMEVRPDEVTGNVCPRPFVQNPKGTGAAIQLTDSRVLQTMVAETKNLTKWVIFCSKFD